MPNYLDELPIVVAKLMLDQQANMVYSPAIRQALYML